MLKYSKQINLKLEELFSNTQTYIYSVHAKSIISAKNRKLRLMWTSPKDRVGSKANSFYGIFVMEIICLILVKKFLVRKKRINHSLPSYVLCLLSSLVGDNFK